MIWGHSSSPCFGTSTGRLGATGGYTELFAQHGSLSCQKLLGQVIALSWHIKKPKNTGGQIPPDPYKGAKEKQVLPVHSAWS